MPVLKPELSKILQDSFGEREKTDSQTRLEDAGLGLDNILAELALLGSNSASENIRLRAAELGLKLHGLLKDAAVVPPSVTINIIDDKKPQGLNPILVPRQAQVQVHDKGHS